MSKVIDLTDKTFGYLTVIERDGSNNDGRAMWLYRCKCGKEKIAMGKDLREGKITSCGCMRGKLNRTHNKSKTKLYKVWKSMRKRCNNKNGTGYKNYGGRGIKVCKEWQKDFVIFYKWAIDNGYKENLSIDRINNDGNYEPLNCRWADRITQNNNTRRNHFITIKNETHTINEWARIIGVPRTTIKSRLKYGWTGEKLLQSRRVQGIKVKEVKEIFDIK